MSKKGYCVRNRTFHDKICEKSEIIILSIDQYKTHTKVQSIYCIIFGKTSWTYITMKERETKLLKNITIKNVFASADLQIYECKYYYNNNKRF